VEVGEELSHARISGQVSSVSGIHHPTTNIRMIFMPESPRWLLSKGRKEDALAALKFIAGKKLRNNRAHIESEYQEIEMRVRQSKQLGKSHFWDAFNPKGKVLYRTMLGFTLQALQQLTGANYFFYYGASIFQAVGISNSYVTQIILGGVNVICTFPGLWFIERFGRRKPLLLGGLWQCAWLIVFAVVGSQLDTNDRAVGAVLITSACMFIAGYLFRGLSDVDLRRLGVRVFGLLLARCSLFTFDLILLRLRRRGIGLGISFLLFLPRLLRVRFSFVMDMCLPGVISWLLWWCSFSITNHRVSISNKSMQCTPIPAPNRGLHQVSFSQFGLIPGWVPKGHKTRYDAIEASKEEEVRGTGIRAETENVENPNGNGYNSYSNGNGSLRSSGDTRIVEQEKENERIPSTNRGKFNVM
jgi:hypothetical protein